MPQLPVLAPADRESARLVTMWVGTALARFAGESLPKPGRVFELLDRDRELRTVLGACPATEWAELSERLIDRLRSIDGRFARAIDRFASSSPEFFLLALAGQVEEEHLFDIALTLLQVPAGGVRPRIHLCHRILATLFGVDDVDLRELAELPLFEQGVLRMLGGDPAPLRELAVDARLWSVLTGTDALWDDCRWIEGGEGTLVAGHVIERLPPIVDALAKGHARGLLVRGLFRSGRRQTAAYVASRLGRRALEVPDKLWFADPAIAVACEVAGWLPVLAPRLRVGDVMRFERVRGYSGPVIAVLGLDGAFEESNLIELELSPLSVGERRGLWLDQLGADTGGLVEEASSAVLSGPMIEAVARGAKLAAEQEGTKVCRRHVGLARRHVGTDELRLLAQPVDRDVPDEALVVTPAVAADLDVLRRRCVRREALWEGLGPTLVATANVGVRALFAGESGTGKTLAASWLASALHAPLYRVDLAAVMNKYVGESEKQLGRLLDLALATDVVLLFDEADALFGQRTTSSETGERYANMLTNFLLTRIESHRGIAILTANSRTRIDPAFIRRLDVIVEFPLPGRQERRNLWRSHLGSRSPGDVAVDRLAAYCDFAGGNVRNVVLAAAAAAPNRATNARISAEDLFAALEPEYRKLGRPVPPQLSRPRSVQEAEET